MNHKAALLTAVWLNCICNGRSDVHRLKFQLVCGTLRLRDDPLWLKTSPSFLNVHFQDALYLFRKAYLK